VVARARCSQFLRRLGGIRVVAGLDGDYPTNIPDCGLEGGCMVGCHHELCGRYWL